MYASKWRGAKGYLEMMLKQRPTKVYTLGRCVEMAKASKHLVLLNAL